MIAFALCALTLALTAAGHGDQTQLEKYVDNRYKQYHLEVPGKEPITIIETAPVDDPRNEWVDISVNLGRGKDDVNLKNVMTDIIHDTNGERPRCYGPSCQEGFVENEGPQGEMDEYLDEYSEKSKDYRDISHDRLQAITALAAKLKKEKIKADHYYGQPSSADVDHDEEEDNSKVYTSWNRLKVKQHKHPYDDKDGWVTLEPVAWSTSKISKWKPNVKKHKPTWTDNNNDRFPGDDKYSDYMGMSNTQSHSQKRPSISRPTLQYINNKLHVTTSNINSNWDSESPSKPSWNKPHLQDSNYYSYPSSWNPDDGRKPHNPNCNTDDHQHQGDDAVFYDVSDSVVTDTRPSHFPYEYEALKRPVRRPTQVVYAGSPELDNDRASRPPYGDGQWVLLSTTKGYRNKKRQRSLSVPVNGDDVMIPPTITSHQVVGLTVLPTNEDHINMTTSHGGLLEVERSFQTVEESKRDMDRKKDLRPDPSDNTVASESRPGYHRVIRRKLISNAGPDTTSVLTAVGAGMVPATMAMVVPMMIGKRRRRDTHDATPQNRMFFKYE